MPERAALYYRKSSDKQEDSIERQKSQVEPLASRRGWSVVAVFQDEGVSGDKTWQRPDFVRLLAEAQAGKFDVIACDDKDRFSRSDSIDYAEIVAQLRRAGVRLETVAQGPIDWDTFQGRMMDAMQQEFKAEEQKAISRRVMTEHSRLAKQGRMVGGPTPLGYRPDPPPPARRVKLVPGDPQDIKTVRLIFTLYADTEASLSGVVDELEARGIPTPTGDRHWQRGTVRKILSNRAYVGDTVWNRVHAGGFSRLKGGEVRANGRRAKWQRNDPSDWVVTQGTHEPLIDPETFDRVQAKLKLAKKRTTPIKGRGPFVLLGLMTCSHCGSRMVGDSHRGRLTYLCGGYVKHRNSCQSNRVDEDAIVGLIGDKLSETFLAPDNLKELRAEVRRQEQATPALTSDLSGQVADLEKKIKQANRKLASIPDDLLAGAIDQIRDWQAQRDKLAREVERSKVSSPVANLEQLIEAVGVLVRDLRAVLKRGKPADVRSLLELVVGKIELRWRHVQRGQQVWSIPDGGTIHLRGDEDPDPSFSLVTVCRRSPRTPANLPASSSACRNG
jgi:DNA invertase Pin-like site-specific DNA recombinase